MHEASVFRGLYDAYPDGVLLVDGRGLIVLANPAVSTLLGYAPETLQGQSVDLLVPLAVTPRHAAYRQGYALAPKSRPMGTELELSARRADGTEVMVEIALSPLQVQGAAGPTDYVVVSVRGVGAYPRVKRAMQRARYNEFVLQLGRVAVDALGPDELLQNMPTVVAQALELDAVGVFLLTPNQLQLRLASYSGANAAEVQKAIYPNRPDTTVGYVVAQRAPLVVANFAREQRFEPSIRLIDSQARSALAVPLNDRGQIIGVLAAWSNSLRKFGDDEVAFLEALSSLLSTTLQRTQAESQLRHAQRMETVGQLTGGIAHDFNNLLTVIQGNLQMLLDRPAVQADAMASQMLAAAARAGQRGADLTSKLLAFSRRQALVPAVVDAPALLQSLADMLRRTLGERVRVLVHPAALTPGASQAAEATQGLHSQSGLACLADEVQLESALLNVAINARDAMPAGGSLQLRCGRGALPSALAGALAAGPVTLAAADTVPGLLAEPGQAEPATEWVWFSVQDSGSGMTEAVRDRAFEPFFTTKEPGRGTGLGLSTVYGFVKQSQGHVSIDSSLGLGTTVTLYLPAVTAPLAGSALPDSGQAGLDAAANSAQATGRPALPSLASLPSLPSLPQGLRVLLVEDDSDVLGVALSFLQSLGCVVQACSQAEAALEVLAEGESFDLLFSDINLGPGLDGRALARRATVLQPELAVLLTSGYARFLSSAAADGRAGQPGQPGQNGKTARPAAWPVLKKPYTQQQLARAMVLSLPIPARSV